jgi:Ni,Fe-hydrogenase I cytochrome b subunit
MKKYSGYFISLVIVVLLALTGVTMSYISNAPGIGAVLCAVLLITVTALGCMPDEDKYKSV